MSLELDYADALRRLALAQVEINQLSETVRMHNGLINTIHRDLHEAAKLIGDIHKSGNLSRPLVERIEAHVAKHGHPQDVPESPE